MLNAGLLNLLNGILDHRKCIEAFVEDILRHSLSWLEAMVMILSANYAIVGLASTLARCFAIKSGFGSLFAVTIPHLIFIQIVSY